MRTAAQRLGDAAELAVADHLEAMGWIVHARNVRVRRRELDLIATDPGPPPALVFVEVRWRSRRDFGLPEETVDGRKRAHVRAAAFDLLESGSLALPRLPVRFDLIVVEPRQRVRHHRNAW